jgi:SAM-dependent methyltransferase
VLRVFTTFGGDRTPYIVRAVAAEAARTPLTRVLDVGCSYGWALGPLAGLADELVGVDMDAAALAQARATYPGIRFVHQDAAALPFPDAHFDVVLLSEVIEHVGEANKPFVIAECWRVLRPGGLFVFTAPYAGLFAWADPMDVKRRFPGLYGRYMRRSGYAPTTPMEVGHKHLSRADSDGLFAGRFAVESVRYCGLLMPWFTWVLAANQRIRLLPKRLDDAINRLRAWESGVPYGPLLSYNVRLTARRLPATPAAPAGAPAALVAEAA